ncbi:MAG: hypothetical protein WC796_00885 [Candidatus Pacearchaeota archaeon]|jgi:hypothetical protein
MAKREVSDKTILDEFVEDFVKIVEKHCKYIIVSGFVAIAHGRSRGTEDIDMILEKISKEQFVKLHNDLIKHKFECMQSKDPELIYTSYLMNHTSVRYTRKGEFLPEMEIKLAKDSIDEYQLATRIKLPFTGLDVYFSTIEMNIAFKEEYLKSDKDIEDAKHLRIIYKDNLNEAEIEKIKKDIRRIRIKDDANRTSRAN